MWGGEELMSTRTEEKELLPETKGVQLSNQEWEKSGNTWGKGGGKSRDSRTKRRKGKKRGTGR